MNFYLLGKSLAHSYSCDIHRMLGSYPYELKNLSEDEFKEFLLNGRWDGVNVTIPYKQVAYELCDVLSDTAISCGSVNTVVRLPDGRMYGENTDYFGLTQAIKRAGVQLFGRNVAILGTGGTSKTAQAVATSMGAKSVAVVSRTKRNGCILYDKLYSLNDLDVIINTTPVGMFPNIFAAPVDLERLKNVCAVVDVIYNPIKTQLIQQAKAMGIKSVNGLYMLVAQAAKASELFLGNSASGIEQVYIKLLNDKKNIAFVGMPGSGKSSLGKEVARLTKREFIDIDEKIVEITGETIPTIFSKFGERQFREIETRVIQQYAAPQNAVISYGGGACQNYVNCVNLSANAHVFFIQRDIKKLAMLGRPLSKSESALRDMYGQRCENYLKVVDKIIDNNGSFNDAINKIMEALNEDFDY